MIKPLKTELKIDTCVLAPTKNNENTSGRIHEVNDDSYVIKYLVDVTKNARKMTRVKIHKRSELVVIYSAWCSEYGIRFVLFSLFALLLCPIAIQNYYSYLPPDSVSLQ